MKLKLEVYNAIIHSMWYFANLLKLFGEKSGHFENMWILSEPLNEFIWNKTSGLAGMQGV